MHPVQPKPKYNYAKAINPVYPHPPKKIILGHISKSLFATKTSQNITEITLIFSQCHIKITLTISLSLLEITLINPNQIKQYPHQTK